MQRKSKTHGPSVGSSPGKWAPTFPKSSVWDLGWGAVPTTNPFLKIYVPIQVLMQGQKPPNRTETHSCTYCMWDKFKNQNAWKPGNRDCKSCTPPKSESSGCPKEFSAFAFLNLQYLTIYFVFLISICFALRFCICIFLHLWFPFFCIFFLQLLFVCIFKIHFFALHAAFFQDSNF